MRPYKIALVLDDSLDTADGVQQYMLTLGAWLTRRGHEVHYIVGETKRTDIPHIHSIGRNVKVRFNGNRMSIPLPVSKRRIHHLMAEHSFDVVHVQMPYSPMLGGRVVKAAEPQTAVVGTFHIAPQSRLVHMANSLLRLFVGGSLQRFDEIMSVSAVAQTFAWQTFGVESSVVPNAIELDTFYKANPRQELKDTTNIIFFGRLVERKGCAQFLRAVRRLHKAKTLPADCRVIVCGKGSLEASLKAYVADHGLSKLVTFTGYVAEEDKASYLAAGDVVVYPSTGGESFGIVLLEGMAAARGVVLAGNNPGYAGVMGERPEALLDPTDEEVFAERLRRYIDSPQERVELHAWQKELVRKFDIDNVADEISIVYDEALHKRRS